MSPRSQALDDLLLIGHHSTLLVQLISVAQTLVACLLKQGEFLRGVGVLFGDIHPGPGRVRDDTIVIVEQEVRPVVDQLTVFVELVGPSGLR